MGKERLSESGGGSGGLGGCPPSMELLPRMVEIGKSIFSNKRRGTQMGRNILGKVNKDRGGETRRQHRES